MNNGYHVGHPNKQKQIKRNWSNELWLQKNETIKLLTLNI